MQSPPNSQDDPSQPSPERQAAADSVLYRTRAAVLLAVAGLSLSLFSAESWGPVALGLSCAVFLASAAICVASFIALKRARAAWPGHLMMAVLLIVTLYFALNSGINLAFWNVTGAYRECVQNSLTISSSGQCEDTLLDSLMHQLGARS